MRISLILLLAFATPVFAAPAPKPVWPTTLILTQGAEAQRFLTIPNQGCSTGYQETRISGVRRFRLLNCPANGGFVQFPENGGPIYSQWAYPSPPPVCPPAPTPIQRSQDCAVTNPGTTGAWTQTQSWIAATPQVPPDGCYVAQPWTPAAAPVGACTQVQTPPPSLVPAVNVSGDSMLPKPARGVTLMTRYGTAINRISDHAADVPGVGMIREDYSRRQPVNADGTRLLAGYNDEYWYVYDITDPAHAVFLEQLNGPAGDAELQWDATDPNALDYLPINGGTVLKKLDIRTNTSTVVWDFTSAVTALWPTARRCWTKSEGSPSEDGRLWGLMCETDGFAPLGFVVLDVNAQTVVWHMNNSVRPDHVSMSPTGRWFEVSGDDARGTIAYGIAADVLGQTRQLHHKSEHSDLGRCGTRDFYASVDYQTNQGDVFWVDLEDATVTRHVVGYVYGHPNPWFGTNYAIHVSAKAFGKCGFLSSNYGVPPANIVWFDFNAPVNTPYGVGVNYAIDQNYFDEVQAALSRDGRSYFYNDNFGGPSQTGDVYRGTLPQ